MILESKYWVAFWTKKKAPKMVIANMIKPHTTFPNIDVQKIANSPTLLQLNSKYICTTFSHNQQFPLIQKIWKLNYINT